MRVVIQRVKEARVVAEGRVTGEIQAGLLVFIAIARSDTQQDANYLVDKLIKLRIFNDGAGKMNRSILQAGGSLLIVSQFTLYGDCHKGNRPSFDLAADLEHASGLYNYFVETARATPVPVETGVFRASMAVYLVNDGPVTIICDSAQK